MAGWEMAEKNVPSRGNWMGKGLGWEGAWSPGVQEHEKNQ